MAFLDERFPIEIDYGSAFGEQYAVDEVVTANGNSYRNLRHPYPVFRYEIGLTPRTEDWMIDNILDFYHRCRGRRDGFRIKNHADFSTNNYRDIPTAGDQPCVLVNPLAGTWQITRWYGDPSDSEASRRRIRKPVAGSVLAGVRDAADTVHSITAWTVDTSTGIITLSASKSKAITGITKASQAVITVGASHGFVVGDSVVSSGVVGMTQINGLRAAVVNTTGSTITVDIDSSGFSDYVSDGNADTWPQTGEQLTAGCYFDIPVNFESDLSGVSFASFRVMSGSVTVVENLNPE